MLRFKDLCCAAMLAGALILPQAALARDDTAVGVGTGAVAGALVAGPLGAVVGGIVGGMVGASSSGARPRRIRRARIARPRREARARPAPIRVGDGSAPGRRTASAVPAKPSATTWTNPR